MFERQLREDDGRAQDGMRGWIDDWAAGRESGDRAVPSELFGKPLLSDARVLFDDDGVVAYGVPTTAGGVWVRVIGPNGDWGGYVAGLGEDGVDWSMSGTDDSLVIHGLIANDVASIHAVIEGERLEARLGENFFFLQLRGRPIARESITELAVVYEGGRTVSLRLEGWTSYAPDDAPEQGADELDESP